MAERLGGSPDPMCRCGHDYHRGPCAGRSQDDGPGLGFCYCLNGELDADR